MPLSSKSDNKYKSYFAAYLGGVVSLGNVKLFINGIGPEHGYGDFVIASIGPDGKANINNIYVVNGNVFGNTYDNRGWEIYLDNNAINKQAEPPKKLFDNLEGYEDEEAIEQVVTAILKLLQQCSNTAVRQMPFKFKQVANNKIVVKPAVIEDYAKKVNEGLQQNKNVRSQIAKQIRFDSFMSLIEVSKEKISFKCYNVLTNGKNELTYSFELPATPDGLKTLYNNATVYIGMLGYIRDGAQNTFRFINKPTKYQHDGVLAYTISSSGMNRKMRLQDYEDEKNHRGYERVGLESQRLYRVINGADNYFDLVQSISNLTVFRGMPAADTLKRMKLPNVDALTGQVIANTAYTSTTLNLHSSFMFANVPNTDKEAGIVLIIRMPVGMHADYIHNIAGWKEQFEVLWDRKYDILVGNKLMVIDGAGGFKYHVFEASVVEHVPFSPIPSFMNISHHMDVPNIQFYDENGRINFTYEAIKGIIKEAFDILKKRGLSHVQIQEKFKYDVDHNDFIVVRAGETDENTNKDICFTYEADTRLIRVGEIITAKSVIEEYKDNEGNIKKFTVTARNYWSDWNRNNGAIDQNYTWETFNGNSKGFSDGSDGGERTIQFRYKSKVGLKGEHSNSEDLGLAVADTIMEYIKYHKECSSLPLQEVARYFDSVFKVTIIEEGYWLKGSIPVERQGSASNEDDGVVPLAYNIDGDNDDDLMLKLKMMKNAYNRKVVVGYRGTTADGSVNEQKNLGWNSFNSTIMEKCCNSILYTFASKLKLNHVRKIDALMGYVQNSCGLRIVHHKIDKSGLNIHQKGNITAYKIWVNIYQKQFVLVKAEVKNRQFKITFQSSKGIQEYIDSLDNRMYDLYNKFMETFNKVEL